jgi:hypothetical protein
MSALDDEDPPEDYVDAPMLLPPEESLDEDEVDIGSDEGYSPGERPRALTAWGITEREAAGHEDLEHRLAREEPETSDARDWDGIGDASDTDGEPIDDQVGDTRAGRLIIADVDPADPRSDYRAYDVGVDGAGASAEEAAVHLVPDEEMPDEFDLTPDDGDPLT